MLRAPDDVWKTGIFGKVQGYFYTQNGTSRHSYGKPGDKSFSITLKRDIVDQFPICVINYSVSSAKEAWFDINVYDWQDTKAVDALLNKFKKHAKKQGAKIALIDFSYVGSGISDSLRLYLTARLKESKSANIVGSQKPLELRL